jgi:hypothetical protein
MLKKLSCTTDMAEFEILNIKIDILFQKPA